MQIPETIERVIIDFDQQKAPFDAHQVQSALSGARAKLRDKTALSEAWADLVPFCLQEEQEEHPPWSTYFGPMGSGRDANGNTTFFPDVRQLTPEILEHWEGRATTLNHPVLRGRYADAVWDLSRNAANRKPDVRFARIAIDSYLEAVQTSRYPDAHDYAIALNRALQIATSLNDSGKVNEIRALMLDRFDQEVQTDGWWHPLYTTLTTNRKAGTTVDEKLRLIAGLEKLFAISISSETLDPHQAGRLADLLLPHYSASEDFGGVKRVGMAVSDAFVTIADQGSRMQAMAWLQSAMDYARRAGETERVKALRIAREEAIRGSSAEMKSFTWSQEVKRSDLDELLGHLVPKDDWGQTLFNIAVYFMPSKADLAATTVRELERSPLMATIPMSVVADDHVAARIGGADEDEEGSLYRFADFARQTASIFLNKSLDGAVEHHRLAAEEIAAFAFRTGLFSDFPLVAAGIGAWMNGDYVKCLFVLVPQIEDAFRNLARRLGEAVTKEKRGQRGWEVSVNLGDLLSMEKIKAEIGPDLHFYFRSIYADARGMNLRNLVAHGLATRELATYRNCDLLVHSLLVLGAYPDVARGTSRRSGAEDFGDIAADGDSGVEEVQEIDRVSVTEIVVKNRQQSVAEKPIRSGKYHRDK
ncbi:DUF4209 domain-containing protein [Sinorhizobium meliloti]|nr:DUF4209 domain-containing protein [Sinorhizobium meliloti]